MLKKVLFLSVVLFSLVSCVDNTKEAKSNDSKKIGVLLVNHGSHSKVWREMLLEVQTSTEKQIMADGRVSKVLTGYMEYNGPSIADQMREFDKEGYDEVIMVPLFLTVSSHTEGDLQNIVGIKKNPETLADLAEEKIEVYKPKAKVTITPLLDFPSLLKKNIARRYKALSNGKGNEGVVLVAYGSTPYNQQWEELMEDIGKYLKVNQGVDNISYSWCGHIVRYSLDPTINAINQVLEMEDNAVVIPVLVAWDPDFQDKIIQGAVNSISRHEERVAYNQDAILPDPNLNNWVIDIVKQTLD